MYIIKQADKLLKSFHNFLKVINYFYIKILSFDCISYNIEHKTKNKQQNQKNTMRFWEIFSPPLSRNDDIYILLLPEPDVLSLLVLWESLFFFEEFCLRCSYVPTRDKNHTRTLYIMHKYGVYVCVCVCVCVYNLDLKRF